MVSDVLVHRLMCDLLRVMNFVLVFVEYRVWLCRASCLFCLPKLLPVGIFDAILQRPYASIEARSGRAGKSSYRLRSGQIRTTADRGCGKSTGDHRRDHASRLGASGRRAQARRLKAARPVPVRRTMQNRHKSSLIVTVHVNNYFWLTVTLGRLKYDPHIVGSRKWSSRQLYFSLSSSWQAPSSSGSMNGARTFCTVRISIHVRNETGISAAASTPYLIF